MLRYNGENGNEVDRIRAEIVKEELKKQVNNSHN